MAPSLWILAPDVSIPFQVRTGCAYSMKTYGPVSDAAVLVSDDVEVGLDNGTKLALRPGQLIGDVRVYSGLASPVDAVAPSPAVLKPGIGLSSAGRVAPTPATLVRPTAIRDIE